MPNSTIQMLNCRIPVVNRYTKNVYSPTEGAKHPITLLRNVRLRVAAEFPDWYNRKIHGQILDEDRITALEFHGGDTRHVDFPDRKWFEGSRELHLVDLVEEVERETKIDALLGCNLTPEDIGRNDLIYIVYNNLNIAPFDEPKEGGKIDMLIFPEFRGGGYFSVRGVKYSIPRLGEDTRILS
ncbi:hypothetical protein HY637_05895 [Candidatus Woesearchaeota archaeon]|nr:hypothetical protein [Candidatus Woesearchaeota archaeon]